jgi:porin
MKAPACLLAVLLGTAAASPAAAEGAAHAHVHQPPPPAAESAVTLDVAYVAELAANLSGGVRRGARYLDNLSVALDADLDRAAGWQDTTLRVSGLWNNGRSISALVGDAQAVSNIETGVRAVRLYDAWIERRFGAVSARAGLYDLNSEFDVLESAAFFTSSAHGIGTDIGQSGLNGPAIFPVTALALRLAVEAAPGVTLRGAVIDGVPGDPDHPKRTTVRLGRGEGALLIGEADVTLGDWRMLAGHWRYTARFDGFDGRPARGNAGWYLRGERSWPLGEGRSLGVFARLGIAAGRFNTFDRFLAAGAVLAAPLPGRAGDAIGVSVSRAWTGADYRRTMPATAAETVLEASWRVALADRLSLQPTVQYVVDPGAAPDVDDALFLGVRASWRFGLGLD